MPIRYLACDYTSWFSIAVVFYALILDMSFSSSFSWYLSIWVKTNVSFEFRTKSKTSVSEMSIPHLLLN